MSLGDNGCRHGEATPHIYVCEVHLKAEGDNDQRTGLLGVKAQRVHTNPIKTYIEVM